MKPVFEAGVRSAFRIWPLACVYENFRIFRVHLRNPGGLSGIVWVVTDFREDSMKLKTRLIFAFCTMFLGPLLLIAVFFLGFGIRTVRNVEKTYGIEFSMNYVINSAQTISDSTARVWEEMNLQAKRDPDAFLNYAFLQGVNEELEDKLSFLLLVKDGEVFYQGREGDLEELLDTLPPYDPEEDDGKGVFIGGARGAVVKQIDLVFSDGVKGSAYIITFLSALLPGFRSAIWQAVFLIMIIQFLVAVILTYWIYRGINVPIGKLREATGRISEGDLDFTLTPEGDDEISELTRSFESMRVRLKESEEEKERYDRESRELISNISHDLKTPITAVKGYVEGIMDGVADTPEKMDRYIRTIYAKANEMDRLINELTFYSKIDTNRIPYHFTQLNVAEFFDDCAEELHEDLQDRKIRFSYENRVEESTCIIADPEQLKRVINNIISNSVKYMDKPLGRIDLRILDAGDFIQVEIEDNGKGIETKDLVNIFDRFYRTDTARSNTQNGSGIGLSIVKKIIEDHNGKIWAGSKLGEGTVMYFVIRKAAVGSAD